MDSLVCWFVGLLVWGERLAASCDDTQSVVFKITEAIRAPLDEFHLSMEAFGDPVVSGKPPHSGDLLFPVLEGSRQRLHGFKTGLFEFFNQSQELLTPLATEELGLMLLIEQTSDVVHLIVYNLERWMGFKERFDTVLLLGGEFFGRFTEQSQTSFFRGEFRR